jgi:hypothetical protein
MLLNMFCMLDVVCCTPRTTVLEAAHLMRRELRHLAADAGLLTEIVSRQQSLEERRVR